MVRSGLRRYPREIVASIREKHNEPEVRIEPDRRIVDPGVALAAAWLGHGSVLSYIGGRWVLVDPVFSKRIGPRIGSRVLGLGRKIEVPPIATTLPAIDAIFITHAHFDHLDRPTLERLANPDTVVVTPRRTARLIPSGFGDIVELEWHRPTHVKDLEVVALEPRHWGARRALDLRRGCNAYLISGGGRSIFCAGDTAHTRAFDGLGAVDLASLGIGAYEPWHHQHATPEQAWEMFQKMGARYLLPVHHSTYPMSDEHPDEPMERLLRVAEPETDRIVGRSLGELFIEGADNGDASQSAQDDPEATGSG